MKTPYVSELQPNCIVTGVFLVQQKDVRQKKTGEPYLTLMLGDRTGDIEARMWDNVAEILDTFDRDDFLKVRGLIQIHHNRLQITVHKLQRVDEASVDFTDYFPASERNPDEMYADLRSVVASINSQPLQTLCAAIIEDPEIAPKLRIAPAAKNVHHAYLGGLLEHVLSMCGLAKLTASHYRDIDLDLLLTGVILHDIGKIHELTYDRSFGYSTDGQLLGHIFIGLRMMDEKIRAIPDFPQRTRTLLEHMILSHHGELAYGSPKTPVFAEALLLHHIDNLDSKMECMRAFLSKDKFVEGCWTGYNATLERTFLKKQKFLELQDQPAAAAAAAQSAGPALQGSPAPQAPRKAPAASPFAEKLLGALGKDQ
jgi:3'-5' exoribonuclease